MKPIRITGTDFGSYPRLDLDLTGVTLAAIVGPNGAGKSTILEAVRVALYGTKAGDLSGFVRKGADRFHLQLDFEVAGRFYRVVREQHVRNGQKASLFAAAADWSDLHPIAETQVRAVDEKIVEVTGCTHDSFILACHLPQGMLGHFASLDPAKRKAWLIENLPLAQWADLEVGAKEQAEAAAKRVTEAEAAIRALADPEGQTVAALLADKTDEQVRYERALEHEKLAAQRLEEARAAAAEYARAVDAVKAAERAVDAADNEVLRIQARLHELAVPAEPTRELPPVPDIPALERCVEELQQEQTRQTVQKERIEAAQRAAEEAMLAVSAAEIDLADLERALKSERERHLRLVETVEAQAASGTCERCGCSDPAHQRSEQARAYDEKRIADSSEQVWAAVERVREKSKERDIAVEKSRAAESVVEALPQVDEGVDDRLRAARHDLDVARRLRREHEERKAAAAAAAEARAKAEALSGELRQAEQRLDAAQGDLRTAQEAVRALTRPDVDDLLREWQSACDAISGCERRLATLEAQLSAAEQRATKRDELEATVAEARHRQQIMSQLVQVYGKRGIQARMIEGAVEEIEGFANAFLSRFTDGMQIELRTQAENKGGGIRETLDIIVTDAAGERPFERFSGGERTRVNFALAVAFAQFLQATRAAVVESFAVDEPEFLDEAGLAELVDCLYILSETVPLVLLISHTVAQDMLPQRLAVIKGANGSSVKVVGA